MNRLNFIKFQERFTIYNFIWQIVRIRWFGFFALVLLNVVSRAVNIIYTQYFNRALINSAGSGNITLGIGIFYIVMYATCENINRVISPIMNKLQFTSVSKIKNNLRNNLYGYTIQHSMNYFNNNFSGVLNNKISSIVRNSENLIILVMDFITLATITILTPVIYAQINIYMGLSFVIISIFYILVLTKLKKKHKEKVRIMKEKKNKYFGLINDDFTNIANIKSFANERSEIHNIKRVNNQILRAAYDFLKVRVLSNTIGIFFRFGFMFSITGIAGYMLTLQQINIGDFMFITIIAAIMKWVLEELTKIMAKFIELSGQIETDIKTIMKPLEIKDKSQKVLAVDSGRIVFRNLYFSYKKEENRK